MNEAVGLAAGAAELHLPPPRWTLLLLLRSSRCGDGARGCGTAREQDQSSLESLRGRRPAGCLQQLLGYISIQASAGRWRFGRVDGIQLVPDLRTLQRAASQLQNRLRQESTLKSVLFLFSLSRWTSSESLLGCGRR